MDISAVVLTKNEEKNIINCLQTLTWCDEILVIDNKSTDNTVEIAKKQKAKVFCATFERDFSRLRNFALENARGEWVFFVDADERVPLALQKEIIRKLKNSHVEGFFIKRIDTLWGKKLTHGDTGNVSLLRLAKRDSGRWTGRVHETWHIEGKTEKLSSPLLHFPHQTIQEFLVHINYYTDLRAQELFENHVRVHWYDMLIYPKAKFIKTYFFQLGFLDGTAGMIVAILMSFHSYLVRAKLWTLWDKK